MDYPVITSGKFTFKQSREDGNVLLLLHGLFGGLSNFNELFEHFKDSHRVVIPVLPIYELPLLKVSVSGLVDYIDEFVDYMGFDKVHVLGNSLGGHIAILYVLKRPEKISSVILTGSSGLFESAMGSSYPRRGDYNYIK
ncbi:MAG TPA: alpha/beta hydrolase, partial [Saprospiraceae bacterium]|nr:alpha/beta hydrolase [Saprospiraceae bacterium]